MANINKESLLTQEYVKELFDYKDGYLYWKVSRTVAVKVGMLAGTVNPGKYGNRRKIGIYPIKKKLYASRIIFLWHHGYMPELIDHIDRNPENNRIENLREATRGQNNKNCASMKNSSSKYLGVHWHKQNKKWTCKVTINGKPKYLGSFNCEIDAAKKFNEAAKLHYGEFANLNVI